MGCALPRQLLRVAATSLSTSCLMPTACCCTGYRFMAAIAQRHFPHHDDKPATLSGYSSTVLVHLYPLPKSSFSMSFTFIWGLIPPDDIEPLFDELALKQT
jgi:hypothetical protein